MAIKGIRSLDNPEELIEEMGRVPINYVFHDLEVLPVTTSKTSKDHESSRRLVPYAVLQGSKGAEKTSLPV